MPTKKSMRSTRSASARSSARRTAAKKGASRRTSARRRSTAHLSGRRTNKSTSACITGAFEGDIMAKGHLCIAAGAKCVANVLGQNVQVDGFVQGRVTARNTMKLGSKAVIKGEIIADNLQAADGAVFIGHCTLGRRRAA